MSFVYLFEIEAREKEIKANYAEFTIELGLRISLCLAVIIIRTTR